MIDTKHLRQLLNQYQLKPNTSQAQHILEYTIQLVSQDCDSGIDIGCGQNWLRTVAACDIIGVDRGGRSVKCHPYTTERLMKLYQLLIK